MTDDTRDNRRGLLSADQYERLRALPRRASGWTRHVRATSTGTNLAQLVTETPDGLDADLAEGRVFAADGTLALELLPGLTPPMSAWVVRLDDGQQLVLAPGVGLPPGRQRFYLLPRSRWVVHGEARPELWDDYRELVLRAQQLDREQIDALRSGQLPARHRAALRASVRAWWIPVVLALAGLAGVATAGASVTAEQLGFALLLGLVGAWGVIRLSSAYRDAHRGTVSSVDGPIHIEVVYGRRKPNLRLVVGGHRFHPTGSDAMSRLVPALHEGIPCRLYRTPTSGRFVAIEPLVGSGIHGLRG